MKKIKKFYLCPKCGKPLIKKEDMQHIDLSRYQYCGECGQKIIQHVISTLNDLRKRKRIK